jgi:dTDP-glucose 4,6-dehydratase
MRAVVTGGAGFIGSALCRRLARTPGWQVLNVDNLTYAANLASLDGAKESPAYSFVGLSPAWSLV